MMSRDLPEADWKVFRELRERALQRFCRRTLSGVEELCRDESKTAHDRYREVSRFTRETRDKIELITGDTSSGR